MQYTNKGNLPAFMAKAVIKDWHDMEDAKYSITQLCKPPRILQLDRRHKDEITGDVGDFFNVFIGSAIHNGIYSALKDNTDFISEKRYIIEHNGVKISGTPDQYEQSTETIYDHKTMTTAAFGLEVKPEYEEQLNLYAFVLRKNGYNVSRLMLNCIYLDWRKAAAKFSDPTKYPSAPCRLVNVPVWSDEKAEQFLTDRLALHEAACDMPDDELPECSAKETWEALGKIAVYPKGGGIKALKLCDTEADVHSWLSWKGMSMSRVQLVNRPASRRRCAEYCSAAQFCSQYKNWLASQNQCAANAISNNED